MPELDPLDIRLTAAVRSFADRAETRVDAMAVASRVVRQPRFGGWDVLGRAVPVPVSVLVVAALLVTFAGWSLTGGGPFPFNVWHGPAAIPTAVPTPSPTPSPTPAPTPTVAPDAPASVTGTGSSTVQLAGTTTLDKDGLAHTTGIVIGVLASMGDPRVTGTGTYRLSVDASGRLGFASGTFRLQNAGGTWEGTCTGSISDGISAGDLSCWLVGSGPYAGLTYYLSHRIAGGLQPDRFLGVILPGPLPSP